MVMVRREVEKACESGSYLIADGKFQPSGISGKVMRSLIQERVLWPVWLFASDLANGSRALGCKRLIRRRIPGRIKDNGSTVL